MSPDPIVDLTKATVALFIIVDPIGLVPVFSNMTKTMSDVDRAKMFRAVIYTGASLLTAFALVGQELLALFWNHSPQLPDSRRPTAPSTVSRHPPQRPKVCETRAA